MYIRKGYNPWNKGKNLPYTIWNKGKKLSEETKKKMRGRKPWNAGTKGLIIGWNRGIPMTEEAKKKVSESRKGIPPWNKGLIGCHAGEKIQGGKAEFQKANFTIVFV